MGILDGKRILHSSSAHGGVDRLRRTRLRTGGVILSSFGRQMKITSVMATH